MSSDIAVEDLSYPFLKPRPPLREFFSSLKEIHTYNPRRNRFAQLGLIVGGMVSLVSILIASYSSLPWSIITVFVSFCPIVFAVAFGSVETIRVRFSRNCLSCRVLHERHFDELAQANAKLKELDRLKAQFMANVTHELKTPLVAIRGYNESILEKRFGPLTSKQQEGLSISVRNIDRLQKLIEELLDFERIDSKEFKIAPTDFDLISLLRTTLKNFQPQIEAKHLVYRERLPEQLVVHADWEKIAQVLLNLLSNAVKFSNDESDIGINVTTQDGKARVTVWDRGPGIPTDAQKFLFTRFWQADGSARRRRGGTGLGLAISKGILDGHGTRLEIVSSEGSGTTAHFELPLAEMKNHEYQSACSGR